MIEQWEKCLQGLRAGLNTWPEHEFIRTGNPEHKDEFVATPTFDKPIWRGETEDITLLVNADFGMGDTIMFWRFIEPLKSKVSKVILRCDNDFKSLLNGVTIVGNDEPLPEFDKVCHMMTLPNYFPNSGKPYITPQPEETHQLLEILRIRSPGVGLCWCGNPFNPNDVNRSIDPDLLGDFNGCYSLVKHAVPPKGILDTRVFLKNWNQTAHMIDALALVITVDTAIAHLAGALGKETWLLLPKHADWRWGTSGATTMWYDSVRLFRQETDWQNLLKEVIRWL